MKRTVMMICLLAVSLGGICQNKKIDFIEGKHLSEILELAKVQKKNVFIDVYASWCVPCKKMDEVVYSSDQVAEFANQNFINVKIQMDRTKQDSELVRLTYPDADQIKSDYNIASFPTYLFLAPDGKFLYQASGYQEPAEFVETLKRANDPKSGLAWLVKSFEARKLPLDQLPAIALKAKKDKQDSIATKMAIAYKRSVIDKSKPAAIMSGTLADFIFGFAKLFTAEDAIIQYLIKNPETLKAFRPKLKVENLTGFIAKIQFINPVIYPNGKTSEKDPDWKMLTGQVSKKLGMSIAEQAILDSRTVYYAKKEEWNQAGKAELERLAKYGIDEKNAYARIQFNNMIWDVFVVHVTDKSLLDSACQYLARVAASNADYLGLRDTYANLLYKCGQREKAIAEEATIVEIEGKSKNKSNLKIYQDTLDKMKNGTLDSWLN